MKLGEVVGRGVNAWMSGGQTLNWKEIQGGVKSAHTVFFSVVSSAHTLRCYPPLQQPIVSSSPHFFSTMLLFSLKTPLSESFDAGVSQYLKASQTELLFCLCLKVSLEARSE